ncbi:MAG TPA: cyclopropane-fatty-acyl-phospholipid synthase family protein [Candidatus Hydrogenedentes bacterium]|nr:cyclopropane-fatty-acyl-phospholipid synthase family protein [Candidatus Hydrogenedentota bacterium]
MDSSVEHNQCKGVYLPDDGVSVGGRKWSSGVMNGWARGALLRLGRHLQWGTVVIRENGEELRFGQRGQGGPSVRIDILHPRFWKRVLFSGQIGAGEAYMDGDWTTDDLFGLVRIAVRNQQIMAGIEQGWRWLTKPLQIVRHALRSNTRSGSRENISAHYDLSNDFFATFLDPTLTYSCGVFETPEATMEEASAAKYDRICRKLALTPEDHVVEIGTGWGGFAMHAARKYGCRVTTTTISEQQYRLASERIRGAGLGDRVQVLLQDYRDLRGRFSKLVSIEMIEAVGHRFLGKFFEVCSGLLAPDGVMAIQAITVPDQAYAQSVRDVDFIKRYIFPGGQCPSVAAMLEAVRDRTDLRLYGLEDLTEHYTTTLLRWRESFLKGLDQVRRLGFDDRFIRMWDFYLALCAGSFAERYTGLVQMVFVKPGYRVG